MPGIWKKLIQRNTNQKATLCRLLKTQRIKALVCVAGAFAAVSGCKGSSEHEEGSEAQRMAALRADGGATYLWQASIIRDNSAMIENEDPLIYQCWYRHDTPAKDGIAKEGADNFELLLKHAEQAKNLNVLAVPTQVLEQAFNEFDWAAAGLAPSAADQSDNAQVNGTLELEDAMVAERVSMAVTVAEMAVEQDLTSPDSPLTTQVLSTAGGENAVAVVPSKAIYCPSPKELVGSKGRPLPVATEQLPNDGTTPANPQLGLVVGAVVKVVELAVRGAALLKNAPTLVRALPAIARTGRTVASASRFGTGAARTALRGFQSVGANVTTRVPQALRGATQTAASIGSRIQTRAGKVIQGTREAITGNIQKARTNAASRAVRKYTPEEKAKFLRLANNTPTNAATRYPRNQQQLLKELRQGEKIDLKNQREGIYQAAKQAGDAAAKRMAANMSNPWVRRAGTVWNFAASWVLVDKIVDAVIPKNESTAKASASSSAPATAEKPTPQVKPEEAQAAASSGAAPTAPAVSSPEGASAGTGTSGTIISAETLSAAEAPSSESSSGAPTSAVMHFSGKQWGGRTLRGQVETLREITRAALNGDKDAKAAAEIIAEGYRFCPAVEQAIRGLGGGASLERLSTQCVQAQ